jgi:hypothetical protein
MDAVVAATQAEYLAWHSQCTMIGSPIPRSSCKTASQSFCASRKVLKRVPKRVPKPIRNVRASRLHVRASTAL